MRHGQHMTDQPDAPDSTKTLPLPEALLAVFAGKPDATLSAPEIAQAIAGDAEWHAMLTPIRRAAVELAQAGRLVIYRKGKPVDPGDFRGVYRLGLPRHD